MSYSLKHRNILAAAILICSLAIYRLKLLEEIFGLSAGSAQYYLIVPLLLSLAIFSIRDFKLPKSALCLALILSILMGLTNLPVSSSNDTGLQVIFVPFSADDNQVQSIRFQDSLKRKIPISDTEISFLNQPNPVGNLKEAKAKLRESQANSILLAGSLRWLTLYFSDRSHVAKPTNNLEGLKLIHQIRSIALSHADTLATQEFVSLIIRALSEISTNPQSNDISTAEVLLADAASIYGSWTTPNHRAYPLWLMATLYLENLSDTQSNEQQVLCAIDYLNKARKLIHDRKSPELLNAILNNRAIAYYLAYQNSGKKKFKKIAIKDFKIASKIVFRKGDLETWSIAKENNWFLNKIKKQKKKKKNLGKKQKKQIKKTKIKNRM